MHLCVKNNLAYLVDKNPRDQMQNQKIKKKLAIDLQIFRKWL